ncbi:MAG: hypothetical protein ACFFFG_14155 [Candidatus Thorarchaeota archaeon]
MNEKFNLKTQLLVSGLVISILTGTAGVVAITNTITRVEAETLGVVWEKTYGGSADDWGSTVIHTSDGGFAVFGTTNSFGEGGQDFWLIKTDANGAVLWNNTYGGSDNDHGFVVLQTADHGFAMLGHTESFGKGGKDFWIVRVDPQGNHLWNNSYGGPADEIFRSAVSTSDGDFILTGATWSYGTGGQNIWLLKVNSTGQVAWNRTLGAGRGLSVIQTTDGGFALSGGHGIHKTNSTGHLEWKNPFGTAGHDFFNNIIQTSNGAYLLSGGSDLHGAAGSNDFILVKVLENGTVDWIKTYGGFGWDNSCCDKALVETANGDFLLTGETNSFGAGQSDAWVVKTNASGNELWHKALGGSSDDTGLAILLNTDGTFMVVGGTASKGAGNDDFWLIKAMETSVSASGFQIGEIFFFVVGALVLIIRLRRLRPSEKIKQTSGRI